MSDLADIMADLAAAAAMCEEHAVRAEAAIDADTRRRMRAKIRNTLTSEFARAMAALVDNHDAAPRIERGVSIQIEAALPHHQAA